MFCTKIHKTFTWDITYARLTSKVISCHQKEHKISSKEIEWDIEFLMERKKSFWNSQMVGHECVQIQFTKSPEVIGDKIHGLHDLDCSQIVVSSKVNWYMVVT